MYLIVDAAIVVGCTIYDPEYLDHIEEYIYHEIFLSQQVTFHECSLKQSLRSALTYVRNSLERQFAIIILLSSLSYLCNIPHMHVYLLAI